MATNRFILGALESAINPGFVLLMSMWYTTEQPLRLEAYYSTIGIATMFGGLIGYAIGHIHSHISNWKYIYIILGSVTMTWGVASLFLLPDSPSTARFFTQREAAVAVERVAANKQGIKNHVFKRYQAIQAAKDPKTWILFLMAIAGQIPTAAVTSKCNTLLQTCPLQITNTDNLKVSLESTSPASASIHSAANTC
jgi:MFS family permease